VVAELERRPPLLVRHTGVDQQFPAAAAWASEAIFLAILGAGAAGDPVAAAKQIMVRLKSIPGGDEGNQLRFTAALTDGRTIYAFRYAVNDGANTLYYRSNRDGTVIASEPLNADRDWTSVPENHVLIAEPEAAPGIFPFSPALALS
jgi:predicted glutamine amidotransferase